MKAPALCHLNYVVSVKNNGNANINPLVSKKNKKTIYDLSRVVEKSLLNTISRQEKNRAIARKQSGE